MKSLYSAMHDTALFVYIIVIEMKFQALRQEWNKYNHGNRVEVLKKSRCQYVYK